MSKPEIALLGAFLRHSRRYVEFGVGGTTILAAECVDDWILSVDSSKDWIERVDRACADKKTSPLILYADIGPVGDWGVPTDPSTRGRWSDYHSEIWKLPKSSCADLYLVDGRFRVACFAQTVLRCSPDAIIGIHDFASRNHYHVVRDIAHEIASAEDISFFLPAPRSRGRALEILDKYRNDPQ
jgi:hypothetical protein